MDITNYCWNPKNFKGNCQISSPADKLSVKLSNKIYHRIQMLWLFDIGGGIAKDRISEMIFEMEGVILKV